ncbi:MAG: AAA family ATPase [Methanomassiliicoccaceae archaeon]|nr:AAA family ATPase [Methanomassiliicoccaceae archaeon]
MRRLAYEKLMKWKDTADRKPLLVRGVRQCGKTYLIKEFGRSNYKNVIYLNFEKDPGLSTQFEGDLSPSRIIRNLSIYLHVTIVPDDTLIIFDEIQACKRAITSLKYFCEEAREYHIICAGSLLGVRSKDPYSFPVGKVNFLYMHPMNFYEFLLANGEERLCEHLRKEPHGVGAAFVPTLEEYYRYYQIVGGMPEAVAKWIRDHDIVSVENIQKEILRTYVDDFSKHAEGEVNELMMIWRSIPKQLSKPNNRFIFSHVKKGKRAKDLEHSLEWLISAGIIHKVKMITMPSIPLSAFSDETIFKIYFVDIGLLRALSDVPPKFIFEKTDENKYFRGAVAENYVLNELKSTEKETFFWRSGNDAEVEFVCLFDSLIVPIEVKSDKNLRSQSLNRYISEYGPEKAVKISMNPDLRNDGVNVRIPLWLSWNITDIISGGM